MSHDPGHESSGTWEQHIQAFLTGGGRFSKATVATYRAPLRRFAEAAQEHGRATPAEIDTAFLEIYGRTLKEWGPAPRTYSLHLVCIRRFIQWMKAHGASHLPEEWQVKSILPSITVADPPVVSTSRPDLKRLLKAVDATPRDRAVWALAAFAGLRASEIARIKAEAFQRGEHGWSVFVARGKRQVVRPIPLVDEVSRAVAAYLEDTGRSLGKCKGYLFEAEDRYAEARGTEGLTRQTIYNVIRRTASEAGISSCNPRELRNAFAVLFLRAGGDLHELQDLLGHQSAAQTAVYLQAEKKSVARETIEKQLALVEETDEVLMRRSAAPEDDGEP